MYKYISIIQTVLDSESLCWHFPSLGLMTVLCLHITYILHHIRQLFDINQRRQILSTSYG